MGHNGYGKSTLLKVLSGLVRPTERTVQYDRPLVFHYVPEKFPVTHLTAGQYLMHMGMTDGVPKERLSAKIRQLAEVGEPLPSGERWLHMARLIWQCGPLSAMGADLGRLQLRVDKKVRKCTAHLVVVNRRFC